MRRRPHPARRPPAPRHGVGRAALRVPEVRRTAVDRPRCDARAGLAGAHRLPVVRICGAAPRPGRDGRGPGREGGRDALACGGSARAGGRGRRRRRRDGATARHRRGRIGPGPVRGRRRRRELPVRPSARNRPRSHISPGDGDPRLLHQPAARRSVDREPPGHSRQSGQSPPGLRLDLPGRRRHRERRASACCRPSATGSPSTRPA